VSIKNVFSEITSNPEAVSGGALGILLFFKKIRRAIVSAIKSSYNFVVRGQSIYNTINTFEATVEDKIQKKIDPVQHSIDSLRSMTTAIYKQLNPNGGYSLFDTVNRIDTRLAIMEMLVIDTKNKEKHGCFYTDEAGNILWVNSTALHMLGMTESEFKNEDWMNCIVDKEELANARYEFDKSLKFGVSFKSRTVEMESLHHAKMMVRISAKPYTIGSTKMFLATLKPIDT